MRHALVLAAALSALALGVAPGTALADDGDPAAGQRVFNQCRSCHTLNQGGRSSIGPNLYGVFGRKAAAVEGFRYSASMREKAAGGLVWNEETLEHYIRNPKAVVPSGTMSFPGLRNEKQIKDLIAYLRRETGAH